jgi:hypothetical protein
MSFFGDERAYTVMQANDSPCVRLWRTPFGAQGKDKGGRSTIGKMPYSLNLAISPWAARSPRRRLYEPEAWIIGKEPALSVCLVRSQKKDIHAPSASASSYLKRDTHAPL